MPKIIEEFEDKAMNLNYCSVTIAQLEFIKKYSKDKNIKQSQLIREILRSYNDKQRQNSTKS